MHIDLARSRKLTREIGARLHRDVQLGGGAPARRTRIDDRFDPAKALAATIRYLKYAQQRLGGRSDLAVVSYHMGIGNLQAGAGQLRRWPAGVLCAAVLRHRSDHHASAFNLLAGFGDDSSLYYWRCLGAIRSCACIGPTAAH